LPLVLSSQARRKGFSLLFREQPRSYSNKALHAWIEHWVYAEVPLTQLFKMQLIFGLAAFALQLPFSVRKDIRRIKGLRYGRRLKGPVLVNAKDFTEAVGGNGIGITTNDSKLPLRIPRDAENKHFLIVGDTGSGKSSIIRQMLYQVDARGDSAIVYDPACEFVKQFYNERRGDIVLNPLDARMPYWNPSKELRRKAEAKALAVSLYQPEGVTNRFFVEAPQKIFAHLLTFLPTPEELCVDVRSCRNRPSRQRNRVLDADRSEGPATADRSTRLSQHERRQLPASAQARRDNLCLDGNQLGRDAARLDLHHFASNHARGTSSLSSVCGLTRSSCVS
jgi:hypothetical protein